MSSRAEAERASGLRAVKLLVLSVFALLAGCSKEPVYSWNQKLTVVVETPQGDVEGSSVTEVHWASHGMGVEYGPYYDGEAVVVPLAGSKYLFVLNRHDTINQGYRSSNLEWASNIIPTIISGRVGSSYFPEFLADIASRKGAAAGPIAVPASQYPVLMSFHNLSDPKSAFEVNPDNLEQSFGPGYRLESMTLQLTDEPPTFGRVQQILPWLSKVRKHFDGEQSNTRAAADPFLNSLASGFFSTRIEK